MTMNGFFEGVGAAIQPIIVSEQRYPNHGAPQASPPHLLRGMGKVRSRMPSDLGTSGS